MIFDSNVNTTVDWNSIQESAYPLGLEGALMHIYENECNYNSIMKAAGIAECKYLKENGGDLFVQEAGATGGLLDRFITFFRSVIKKIQEMFKKLFMKIASYTASDKKFVNTYKKKVFANFKSFNFTGWKKLVGEINKPDYNKITVKVGDANVLAKSIQFDTAMNDDQVEEKLKSYRALIANSTDTDLDAKEFQTAIKELMYGDEKEEFEISSSMVARCFDFISDTKKNVKDAERSRDNIVREINNFIKNLEKAKDIVLNGMDTKTDSEAELNNNSTRINAISKKVELEKGLTTIYTTAYGAEIGAIKDRNRQAKAICVKALNSGSKKSTEESAIYGVEDIFANVEII